MRSRPARRGDEREGALLATAERLLAEGTYESTSLNEIARLSGVSRPGFYFYFASKDALLSTLIVRTLDLLGAAFPPSGEVSEADPVSELRHSVHEAAEMWFEHRAVLMAATELSTREPAVFDRVAESQVGHIVPTSALLRHGGRVRSDSQARELAEMFTWMAERNFYILSRGTPTRPQLHAMAERLLDVLLRAAGFDEDTPGEEAPDGASAAPTGGPAPER